MPAQSGVLPARYLLLTECGEPLRESCPVACTMRWLFDEESRLAQGARAAHADATSPRTGGDSGTIAAHRPGGAERGWPLLAAQALPAPQLRLSRPHRATHR